MNTEINKERLDKASAEAKDKLRVAHKPIYFESGFEEGVKFALENGGLLLEEKEYLISRGEFAHTAMKELLRAGMLSTHDRDRFNKLAERAWAIADAMCKKQIK